MLGGVGLSVFGLGFKQPSIEVQYRVLNFNTGLDPRFKIQGSTEKFPEILNLESWIPSSIEVQYSVLNFNSIIELQYWPASQILVFIETFLWILEILNLGSRPVLSSIILLKFNTGFHKPKP